MKDGKINNDNQYQNNNSNLSNSTIDNFSLNSNFTYDNHNKLDNINKRDQLMYLINREKIVLKNANPLNNMKPNFGELKNNILLIQHSVDNFIEITGKKIGKKIKKDDDFLYY